MSEKAVRVHSRYRVLDVPITAVDLTRASIAVVDLQARRRGGYVCVTGVHGVMESRVAPDLRHAHEQADLVVADGMPLVWCGKWAGVAAGHVRGADLVRRVIGEGVQRGTRHYFFGTNTFVLESLRRRLQHNYPGIALAGMAAPPYQSLEGAVSESYVKDIRDARPDIVWVGLSTPKQERWMNVNYRELAPAILIGVGAAFDFLAGTRREAPAWLRHTGFEWLYRVGCEPVRLGSRYLRNNPQFLVHLTLRPPHRLPDVPFPSIDHTL